MTDDELVAQYLETGDDTLLAMLPAAEAADLREMRALLGDESTWGEPSPEVAARIDAEVRRTDQVTSAGVTTPQRTPGRPTSGTVVDIASVRKKRWSAPTLALVGAAAGVVVTVGAVGVIGTRDGDGFDRQVAVTATDLGGGVAGNALVTSQAAGFEIVLEIDGLPRSAPGTYYQGWVKGERGLVTIGTFHTGGHVVLWSGVDLADYPTLTVTIEPEDGDPASSGQVVLTAPVGP